MSSGPQQTVGRDGELEQLDSVLAALDEGTAACLTVEGEPGIGKTRLLRELCDRAEAAGHLVLNGSSAEFEQDMPFGVWVDALDAYMASQDPGEANGWDPRVLAELGVALPSLAAPGGDHGVADERYRVHRAMRSLLERLAEPKPLVLVFDDLHWSDTASLELIAALLRRGPDAPVLFALAFRPGQASEQLSAALAVPTLQRIELSHLSEAEAATMLDGVDAGTVAHIYRQGGGNPFYLEQLARASDAGRLPAPSAGGGDGNGATGVPAAVSALLAGEIESLPEITRAMLNGAAVAGEPFEPDLAAAAAKLSEEEGLTALDDLLELDLVRPTQVPRHFVFRHPLVRQAVYESTRGGWRLAAHARAAEALAARGAGPAERAHHVEQSAAAGDEPAIELLLAAGEAAAARAPAAAGRWYEAALRLLPAADSERHVELRVALASALRSLGDLDRCRSTLLEAVEMLPAEDAARRVELTALCAAVEHWQGRHQDAHRRLSKAWDELPDRSTEAAAALLIELSVDGLYELDYDQSIERGREALDTARSVGDPALIAAAASALCLGLAVGGHVDEARARHEAALAVDGLSDTELAPRLEALYYLGWAENYLEHYDQAIEHVDRGIAIARATGAGRLLVPMMLVKGYPLEIQGRLAEALEVCEQAVESARLSANPHYQFWALFELGWVHYYRGDLHAALDVLEESGRVGGLLAGATMPAGSGGPGWPLAATLFELGDVERGFEVMREIGGDELVHAIPVESCFYWEILALAELRRGQPGAAAAHMARADAHAATLDLRLPETVTRRGQAALLLASGDLDGAAKAARESVTAGEAIGAQLPAAYARGLLGQVLAAAGDRAGAIEELRGAESELDRCGSVRVRDELRRDLRKLGARAETRGPATGEDSGVGSLTKRELEIATLVTERKTNREIAAELFLSEKTVESHMRNIFVKLGSSSRVEVARTVERERREQVTG